MWWVILNRHGWIVDWYYDMLDAMLDMRNGDVLVCWTDDELDFELWLDDIGGW
jgi:hypothetical protein